MSEALTNNTRHHTRVQSVDLSGQRNISILLHEMSTLSQATDPRVALDVFADAMRQSYGPKMYVLLSTLGLDPGQYRIRRLLDDQGCEHTQAIDLSTDARNVRVHSGGLLGEIVRDGRPRLVHHLRVPHDPVLGDVLGSYESMLAMPIFMEGGIADWLVLFERRAESAFGNFPPLSLVDHHASGRA